MCIYWKNSYYISETIVNCTFAVFNICIISAIFVHVKKTASQQFHNTFLQPPWAAAVVTGVEDSPSTAPERPRVAKSPALGTIHRPCQTNLWGWYVDTVKSPTSSTLKIHIIWQTCVKLFFFSLSLSLSLSLERPKKKYSAWNPNKIRSCRFCPSVLPGTRITTHHNLYSHTYQVTWQTIHVFQHTLCKVSKSL